MKRRRDEERRAKRPRARVKKPPAGPANSDQITEMLKVCLQKVCELQSDLQRDEGREDDPEAAGYAACALETMRFLNREGLPSDHPMVKSLRERLFRDRD